MRTLILLLYQLCQSRKTELNAHNISALHQIMKFTIVAFLCGLSLSVHALPLPMGTEHASNACDECKMVKQFTVQLGRKDGLRKIESCVKDCESIVDVMTSVGGGWNLASSCPAICKSRGGKGSGCDGLCQCPECWSCQETLALLRDYKGENCDEYCAGHVAYGCPATTGKCHELCLAVSKEDSDKAICQELKLCPKGSNELV